MRKLITYQEELDKTPRLGYTPIEEVQLDQSCRDEITKTLRGIQALYSHQDTRDELFRILQTMMTVGSSKKLVAKAWIYGLFLFWQHYAYHVIGTTISYEAALIIIAVSVKLLESICSVISTN